MFLKLLLLQNQTMRSSLTFQIVTLSHEPLMKHQHFEILCFVMIFNVSIKIINVASIFLQRIINESSMKHQWNVDVAEISTLKTLMILNVCIKIINVSSTLHRCRIVVSLMNRRVFSMTILMMHQCSHCDLAWGTPIQPMC